ncbi:Cytochrome c oxidase subunit 2 precursor [Afipia felis]|uniref:Cytochrome aa3 subunit 2 n=1 Tax=Afipia felis TaxID=1035 RepID=A0A090MH80_AFIFE|nr:cytochrome c oxidase subunit II [Afipia felis]CEG06990.1 Cytochrome c oxidase subunit 2 precursor [Afipia felis]
MREGLSLPLGMFEPAGAGARAIHPLLWWLVWLSIIVVVFIAVVVVAGIFIRGRRTCEPNLVIPAHAGRGLWWIYGGVGVSTIILIAFVGWTVTTMARLTAPPSAPSLTVEVSARQWWWGFHYDDPDPAKAFNTANEIHIPVGEPVRFNLSSPDVIHSFWVPALAGKVDVIPGRSNSLWLEADKPGIYRGQCSEYCGRQHAEMAFYVIAEPRLQFDAWRAAQQAPAPEPATAELHDGLAHFVNRCGKCHVVRGTKAKGDKGPDLTHIMNRSRIAAGMLDNNLGNLSGWIAHPQGLKPGALMPDIAMSGPEFQSILSYVETLK